MDTTTAPLVAAAAGKGATLHLVPEGGTRTLCGRPTTRNPRHLYPGHLGVQPAEAATCPRCDKAAR